MTKAWIKSSKTVVKPAVGEGEGLTECEGVVLGLKDLETEGLTDKEGEGVGVGLGEAEGEGDLLLLIDKDGLTEAEGDALLVRPISSSA